jgi:hypothetical protein
MSPHQRRQLERLQRLVDEVQSLVRDLLNADGQAHLQQRNRPPFDAPAFLAEIRNADRSHAESLLLERNYRELGAIFMAAGGTSVDAKRPKDWLIGQILWQVFDFQRGHEAIRSRGGQEGQ